MLVPLMNATFIRRITRGVAFMTMRKGGRTNQGSGDCPDRHGWISVSGRQPLPTDCGHSRPVRTSGPTALALATAFLAGCSTPGPMHLYSVSRKPQVIHDVAIAADVARDVPAFVNESEQVVGFAYDPFTDHLFLRLAPGDRIRVVDRPARKIKREFALAGAHSRTGDIAVRPRDGHILIIDGNEPELLETTRLGEFVRRLRLDGGPAQPVAIAVDQKSEDLFVLDADLRTVTRCDSTGRALGRSVLSRIVEPSFAYDGNAQQFYAPLRDTPASVGVFDLKGQLVRTVNISAGDTLIDTGPHSFFRMF